MSQISSWIISICGVALVGIILDVLMSNNKNYKLVKSIFAIITIMIIIKPFSQFNYKDISFNQVPSSLAVDSSFVDLRNKEKINELTNSIIKSLSNNGYKNINISFEQNYENSLIKSIFVDLSNLVLTDNNLNINKYTNILAIIKQFVNIEEGQVIFNEWRKNWQ